MSNTFISPDLMRKPLIFNRLPWVSSRETSSSSKVLCIKRLKTKTHKRKKQVDGGFELCD